MTPCSLVDINRSEEPNAFHCSYAMKIRAEYGFEVLVLSARLHGVMSCNAVMLVFTRMRVPDLIHNHIGQSTTSLP